MIGGRGSLVVEQRRQDGGQGSVALPALLEEGVVEESGRRGPQTGRPRETDLDEVVERLRKLALLHGSKGGVVRLRNVCTRAHARVGLLTAG